MPATGQSSTGEVYLLRCCSFLETRYVLPRSFRRLPRLILFLLHTFLPVYCPALHVWCCSFAFFGLSLIYAIPPFPFCLSLSASFQTPLIHETHTLQCFPRQSFWECQNQLTRSTGARRHLSGRVRVVPLADGDDDATTSLYVLCPDGDEDATNRMYVLWRTCDADETTRLSVPCYCSVSEFRVLV